MELSVLSIFLGYKRLHARELATLPVELIAQRIKLFSSKHSPQFINHHKTYIYCLLFSSEIGKLHELAVRNHLKPAYEVITSTGPSHLMKFSVKCSVGRYETTGEAIGKKNAKKIAAKKMLDLLSNAEDIKPLPDDSKSAISL